MKYGEICSRCGGCCKAIPCGIAMAIFGDNRPCPALEENKNIYTCGLVLHASEYIDLGESMEWKDLWFGKMVSGMLGIGMGCCSSPEGERIAMEMRVVLKKIKYKQPKDF